MALTLLAQACVACPVPQHSSSEPPAGVSSDAGDAPPAGDEGIRSGADWATRRELASEENARESCVCTDEDSTLSIVIAVRNSDQTDDDYVTWAPARCTIRIQSGAPNGQDISVTLTNDDPGITPTAGDLKFAKDVDPGKTATDDSVQLTLPADGTPVEFFIAGIKHSRLTDQSLTSNGRDAVIIVRRGGATGNEIGRHAVMVRVRMNATDMNDLERQEYLDAVATIKGTGRYEELVDLHTVAAGRMVFPPEWPDQAHRNSGFLPWHRMFLLAYERELQKTHPHVSLPYWREDQVSSVFVESFLGANAITPFGLVNVNFGDLADGNPLHGWDINGTGLQRRGRNRLDTSWCDDQSDVIFPDKYRDIPDGFSESVEGNPHDVGHGWVGGWMGDCRTSPRDPIFFLFHCDIDRLWAQWQREHGRFETDGSDPNHYSPNDEFTTGSTIPMGHHLKDTMWPWDGVKGEGDASDFFDNRPDSAPDSPFPASGVDGVWPDQPAQPFVHQMIDYLGAGGTGPDLGFCYDDAPFGVNHQSVAPASLVAGLDELNRFINSRQSIAVREKAADEIKGPVTDDQLSQLRRVAEDKTDADKLRSAALKMLEKRRDEQWIDIAISIVKDGENAGAELRTSVARQLGTAAMFSQQGMKASKRIRAALREVIQPESPEALRVAALESLATSKDKQILTALRRDIRNHAEDVASLEQSVRILSMAQPGMNYNVLRPLIESKEATNVRLAAISSLGADANSIDKRISIAADSDEPQAVREAALKSLLHEPRLVEIALKIAEDDGEDSGFRASATTLTHLYVIYNSRNVETSEIGEIRSRIGKIKATEHKLKQVIDRTVSRIDRILRARD